MNTNKFDKVMMKTAIEWAKLSHAERKKVGSVIAKNNCPVMASYNGNPSQLENECEDENGVTKSTVLHSEENAIIRCALKGISTEGADLYCTSLPCHHCASIIITSGIKRVFFIEEYISKTNSTSRDIFDVAGIDLIQISLEEYNL